MRRCGRSLLIPLALALLSLPRSLAAAAGDALMTITPCRAVDTRNPAGPHGGPALGANETRIFTLTGTCSVSPDALALAVNITVVQPAATGFAQLYAGDAAAPPTSVLSFSAGRTRAGNAIVALASDSSGTVALANASAGSADFVLDITGFFVTTCPPPPPPVITPTPARVCAGSTGNTASGPAATTWAWTITNGTITSAANIQTITYTAGTSGNVGLTLLVTNASTCSAQSSLDVPIDAIPATPTINPTPAQVCAGSAGNTADGPAGATTYAWSITNGTITSATNIQTITYTAGSSGTVGLTLVVMNGPACAASNGINVPINASPATPTIGASNPQTFTVSGAGGTFTLTFTGQTAVSLPFNATAAQVQAALNALSSIGGVGGTAGVTQVGNVYTVTFGGTLTGPQPLLTAAGAGGCTVDVDPPAACGDSTGNLARGPAGATTYAWSITNGTITSATDIQTITYTAGPSGNVGLTLVVTNASHCPASNTLSVAIDPSPATPPIVPTPAQVCANSTGNTADGPAGAATYAWSVSNGTITSATNIQTITYTAGASGNVGLTLVVTNLPANCSASNTINVPINASPAAPTITPVPAQVCAGAAGNGASGPAGAASYAWSISNGTITSATNIQTITYTAGAAGNVTLNLTVANAAGCVATSSALVPINANAATPTILTSNPQTFTVSGVSGTFTLTFSGATTPPLAFNATAAQVQTALDALATISGVGGSVAVTQVGDFYTVTLGGTLTGPQPQLTASGAGGATVVVDAPAVCADSTGNLARGPAGAAIYAWSITNGAITSATNIQTITYTAGSSGNVGLTLTITNPGGCSATNSINVPINPVPASPMITPTPAQVCANSTGNTADGPAGATTYAWSISNGTITSATDVQTITYTAGASGNVTLNLTVTNASHCAASKSLDVPINPAPAVPTITPTPATVCANVAGNGAAGPAGATTYAWSISNGTITSATNTQSITYTAGASGNVGLTLVVTNSQGCSAQNSINVPINPLPTLTPGAGALTTGTYNTAYSQSFTPGGGTGPYTVALLSGTLPHGVTFAGTTLSGTPLEPGGVATGNFSFTLRVTDTATGCVKDFAYTLFVQPKAVADSCTGVGNTQLMGGAYTPAPTTPFSTNCNAVLANDQGPGSLSTTVFGVPVNGTVSLNSNGTFLFTPNLGATTGSFNYTLTDGNSATATATVTLTFSGVVWYVNNTIGSSGDGRSHNPFKLLSDAQGPGAGKPQTGQTIYVHTGSGATTGNLNLLASQVLVGNGVAFTIGNLSLSAGTKPILSGTVALASDNSISGFTFNPAGSGSAITGSSVTGTSTINQNTIALSNAGAAVSLTGGAGTINFTSTSISQSGSGTGISIGSKTGGTVSFDVASPISVTGAGATGVNLTSNTGATITFAGGLTLTTTTGNAFAATGGGTVTATQNNISIVNTLTTTTGTALNVASTTIGAAGLTFRSISSSGATSGITINTTGSSGGLTISGNGGAGTGGSILNSTTDGVVLTSTDSPSLNWLNITDSAGGATDDGLVMTNITGTVTIANCIIANSPHNGITVDNNNTNMAGFNLTNTTVSCASGQPCQPSGSIGNDGLLLGMRGTSVLTSGTISGSTFSGVRATGVQVTANDSGRIGANSGGSITTSILVQNNTFTGNGQGIDIDSSQVSSVTFQVLNNTINGKLTAPGSIPNQASSTAINAFTAAGADTGPASHSFVGKIEGNTIGTQGVKDSGSGFGSGIRVVIQGQTTQGIVTVSNNTIREVPNAAILNFFGQNGAAASGSNSAHFKIINNTMPAPSGSNLSLCGPANTPCADTGIFILADEGTLVCDIITGNSVYDVTTMNGSFDVYLAERAGPPAGAQLTVEGTGGSNSAYIQANNTLSGGSKFLDEGGNTSQVGAGVCGAFP